MLFNIIIIMSGDNHGTTSYINVNKIPIPNSNSTKPMKFSQLVRNGHRYGRTQVITNSDYTPSSESYGQALANKF